MKEKQSKEWSLERKFATERHKGLIQPNASLFLNPVSSGFADRNQSTVWGIYNLGGLFFQPFKKNKNLCSYMFLNKKDLHT